MAHTPLRLAPHIAAAFSLLTVVTAQDAPIRFVPKDPMIRLSACDAPALLAALPSMHLGKLFAEPEVAAAIELGHRNYVAKVMRWTRVVDRLAGIAPDKVDIQARLQRQVFDLDWRDLRSGELIAVRLDERRFGLQSMLLLEPTAAAEGRLAQRFEAVANGLRAVADDGTVHEGWGNFAEQAIDTFGK